jgi:hypothetical protein
LYWGFIEAFTKVLTIYHSLIHSLPHSLLFTPPHTIHGIVSTGLLNIFFEETLKKREREKIIPQR